MNNEACIDTKNDEFCIREKVYIADIATLKEQVRSLQVKLFGRSSEAKITLDDKQLNLFDTSEDELPTTDDLDDEIEIPGYKRKKTGRKPLPEDLPRRESRPIVKDFKKWLDSRLEKVPPTSLLGKAINYTLGQWHRLTPFLKDGRIPMDNNTAENAIRPFVIGRKNWLFSCTAKGARASATFYSLIETAKANKLEPYWYLRYLFKNLPEAMNVEEFKQLLPMNVDREALNIPDYK